MNIFEMKGAWGRFETLAYEQLVASGLGPLYDRLLQDMEPRIPPEARVLDLGCGSGAVACSLAQRRGDLAVTGLDLSPDMIRRSRERARKENVANVQFREGDALSIPFPPNQFAVAYSVASIKHWPEPEQGIQEMVRVIRPGGRVLVLEADRETNRQRALNFVRLWPYRLPGTTGIRAHYFRRYVAGGGVTASQLKEWLLGAGLQEVEVQADPEQPVVIAQGTVPIDRP